VERKPEKRKTKSKFVQHKTKNSMFINESMFCFFF
jgi:hypothetical protein